MANEVFDGCVSCHQNSFTGSKFRQSVRFVPGAHSATAYIARLDILFVEIAHALTSAERRNIIPKGHGISKLAGITKSEAIVHTYVPLLFRAVELSSQFRIGVYDCIYVALAEQESCELVTADTRLIRSLPGFPIRDLATLP